MPTPSTSAASAWGGAPPVSGDGFAFANGDFFAEVSGKNRHRRATQAELKEHFASGSDKDHPAHWFEAQLVHYGLQPSKTKAVARMRLFDAVNAGKLAVPAHITKLEGALKKEWTAKDREAKKALKSQAVAGKQSAATGQTSGVKRKAEAGVNSRSTASAATSSKQPAAKKAKTSTPKKTEQTPVAQRAKGATKAAAKEETAGAKTVAKKAKPAAAKKASGEAKATASAKPAKQTARPSPSTARRLIAASQGNAHGTATTITSQERAHWPKQTARRGRPFVARGRTQAPTGRVASYDGPGGFDTHGGFGGHDNFGHYDPPPPYVEHEGFYDDDDQIILSSLGLLNGGYDVRCQRVVEEWPDVGEDFDLVLTLAGSSMWGRFDLGIVEGVMYFDERPLSSSDEPVPFQWCGRENEGEIIYDGTGWMTFLGGGRVEGGIRYQGIEFQGVRFPGQGTRSEISAAQLQDEWDEYSEEQYEQERVNRWR